MSSSKNTSHTYLDSSSTTTLKHSLGSEVKHPGCSISSSKCPILLLPCEVPLLSSLDERSHSFPSVFSSPFTKSSLCSFLLAMPSCNQSPVAAAFSSLSTLAFLSMSVSTKTRSVSNNLDEQVQASPASSLVATFAGALRSLFSTERPNTQIVKKAKNVFQPSGKLLSRHAVGGPAIGTNGMHTKEYIAQTNSLHDLEDGNLSGSGFEEWSNSVNTRNVFEEDAEVERLSSDKKSESHPKAEKIVSVSKHLVAGAVSTIVSRTFVAPLERLKLEYIVGGAKHSWAIVIRGIWVAEGPGGFWKGNILNLLRMVPFKSINFLTYDMFCKEILERQGKEVTNLDRLSAGAASGAAATLICLPLDTIRTRLIAPGGEALGGMLGCLHQMIDKEGFLSLYRGLLPALLSMVPAGAVFYGVYDILKAAYLQSPKAQRELLKRIKAEKARSFTTSGVMVTDESEKISPQVELGPIRTLVYGAIAGACAEIVTYPLEVVRRQLQLQQTTAKMGLITAFQTIIERDGVSALFSGVVPSTVQVLPSAALSYLVYEFMKSILKTS